MATAYADRIKKLRNERVWSQDALATVSGINVRTVQRVERGHAASPDTLKALANAFEINVTDLVQANVHHPTVAASDSRRLLQIRTGRDLFGLVGGAKVFRLDHGDIDNDMVPFVASFLQDLMDSEGIWLRMDPGDRIRLSSQFTSQIQDLEDAGLYVFAGRQSGLATVYVVKNTDPGIVPFPGAVVEDNHARSGGNSCPLMSGEN